MRFRTTLPAALEELAATRSGVLTRPELLDAGVSRHAITRMAQGWHTLARGTYLIDPRADEWLAKVHAGVLLGGAGAAAWGSTAAALWGVADRPSTIEILASSFRRTEEPWLRFRRQNGRLVRRISPLSPPRVNLEDAVIDTGAAGTASDALAIIGRVLQERRTTPERLMSSLSARERVRHRALLTVAIGDSASGAHSALEHRYLADVQRPHGLPDLSRQYVVLETGHAADLAAPDRRLLIELDGLRYHDREADRQLDIVHGSHGYITIRLFWVDVVGSPCEVARRLALALGVPLGRRCRRCPAA